MILLVLLLVYHLNGDFQYIADAEPNVYLPVSVLNEGNLSFRPSEMPFMFDWALRTSTPARTATVTHWNAAIDRLYSTGALTVVRSHYNVLPSIRSDPAKGERLYINTFGPGAGLTALPIFALAHLTVGNLGEHPRLLWYLAKSVASVLVAASAAFVYLAARRFLARHLAALLALSYGLGTCVWSTSTQSLWQHGPNEFFLALGSAFLFGMHAVPTGRCSARGNAALCALAFTCAFACRPTSAVVLVTVAAYLAATDRRAFVAYVLGALPIVLALGAYSAYYLGSPSSF